MTLPIGWKRTALGSVLERVTLPVNIETTHEYREIGIRSHGKGIFHKPPVTGGSLGDKRVFWIISCAEREIAGRAKNLALLKAQKQALQCQLLTGKHRVRLLDSATETAA